jgi:threonine synthase
MNYYSTNNRSLKADFREAAIQGQAPDKGLYFPETIPQLPKGFIDALDSLSKEELSFTVMKPYVGNTIADADLEKIVTETVNFPFPLLPVTESISTLELFHGPTLAFKDVGARFMSRCLGHFVKNRDKEITVLVATSGDTGGAVANGFYNVEGVNVVILYPSGKVSLTQEVQLTTLGNNITAIEVEGSFDDCQQMVKNAFMDEELKKALFLTSANSINVARWLPQQLYYFFAHQQWKEKGAPPVVCVPSGNFGNICAGLLAHLSGLPVKHFIAACNANDTVPQFLANGEYKAKPSVPTLSNAMDVGNPSNFVRIMELFNHEVPALKNMLTAYSISDDETKATLKAIYEQTGYVLDPHGAVGYLALQRYLADAEGAKGYFLETAHPVKFYDAIEPVIGKKIPVPESIAVLLKQEKKSILMKPDDAALKSFLLERCFQLEE